MEILVLMMLALFIGIIVISIVMYVVFKNNVINKSFDEKITNDIDYPLDDENDDFMLSNVTLPINFHKLMEEESKVENTELIKQEDAHHIDIEENLQKEITENKINDLGIISDNEDNNQNSIIFNNNIEDNSNNSLNNIHNNVINNYNKEKKEEVVNILIDKKNYIFLANNNKVSKNEHLKLIINNKIYFGTVIKANYIRDISLLKNKPRKLIIVKNKVKKEMIENKIIDNDDEFIPIKRKKD